MCRSSHSACNLFCSCRVSIDELQKHTELDLDTENEFTVEEVRVRNEFSSSKHLPSIVRWVRQYSVLIP